jgi:hypothetical protein
MLNWLIARLRGEPTTFSNDNGELRVRLNARAHTRKAPVFEIKNPTQWKLERIRRKARS